MFHGKIHVMRLSQEPHELVPFLGDMLFVLSLEILKFDH